jgi:hypothetical protein
MSRTNPQTNPMAPMGSTGIPVTKMGSVTMVDWSALSSPANRTNFGMAPQQAMELPPSTGAVDEDTPLDLALEVLFGEDALKFADEYSGKIAASISSWWEKETERMSEQRAAKTEFGEAILTAITEGTKGFFVGSVKAFKAVADELNIPTPSRKQSKTVWDEVVSPVINAGRTSASQLFPGVGVTSRFIDVITGVVADKVHKGQTGGNLQSIMAAPAAQVAAARKQLALEAQNKTASLQTKLRSAGIEESLDESTQLYYAFTGRMANIVKNEAERFKQPEFRTDATGKIISGPPPGTPNVFYSVPLGLEPFARENPDKTFSLVGRFYSAEQQAAIDLSTPGMFTREELTERLQSDPGLVDAASFARGGGDGRYLTPQTVLDNDGIMQTLGRMRSSELHSLKSTMARLGYMDAEDIGDPTIRRIDNPTLTGFGNLVRNAQENGYTWNGWTDYATEKNMFLGKAAPQRQAPLIRVTSPTDLKAVANRVAQQTIGYQLDEGELEQFVASYQDMERRSQMREAGGGTVASAPTAATAAEEMIAGGARKTEADAFAVGNTIDVMRQIMTGGMR